MVKAKNRINVGDRTTIYFSFCSAYIDAIGYDAQCELLEVRLLRSSRVRCYFNVPEEVWYQFRDSASPDIYYRSRICGHFPEKNAGRHGQRC